MRDFMLICLLPAELQECPEARSLEFRRHEIIASREILVLAAPHAGLDTDTYLLPLERRSHI